MVPSSIEIDYLSGSKIDGPETRRQERDIAVTQSMPNTRAGFGQTRRVLGRPRNDSWPSAIAFPFEAFVALVIVTLACAIIVKPAQAFHPQSPEVQAMVTKAVRFLNKENYFSDRERVLAAMALLKAGEPATNPVVEVAKKDCLEWCGSDSMIEGALPSIYEVAVVGLFFCELDPVAYKTQIQRLIRALEKRQKPFGAWGYPKPSGDWKTGDTSMTQYVILFAWTAQATGAAEMSNDAIRRVTNWLLRTQDPTGAWGYQGNDPGNFQRVKQTEVRHSLAAAGVGSLYICSGMLGFTSDEVDDMASSQRSPTGAQTGDYNYGDGANTGRRDRRQSAAIGHAGRGSLV